jgi:hypothetical protein
MEAAGQPAASPCPVCHSLLILRHWVNTVGEGRLFLSLDRRGITSSSLSTCNLCSMPSLLEIMVWQWGGATQDLGYELPRMPKRRSSQKSYSTHSSE